jgi:hypothetical protein
VGGSLNHPLEVPVYTVGKSWSTHGTHIVPAKLISYPAHSIVEIIFQAIVDAEAVNTRRKGEVAVVTLEKGFCEGSQSDALAMIGKVLP